MPRMKVAQVAKPNDVQSNVRPMIETFPLAKAADAYQRMMSGKARFRVVLIP